MPELRSTANESSTETLEQQETKAVKANDEPYTVLKTWHIVGILSITAFAGALSPLNASIYFPALNEIELDLGISAEMVNLTITTYLIFQAISPTFWGSIADVWGRRLVYIGTTLVYCLACVGLAVQRNYGAMLFLRMLQSFGSSSLIAVGAGVIGDITTPAQRGGFYGYYNMGQLLGPVIGPVIGGVVAGSIGWRWTFWILAILAGSSFVLLSLFVPETLRALVGNGSGYCNPTPWQWWQRRKLIKKGEAVPPVDKQVAARWRKMPNFIQPFLFLFEVDVILLLLYNGYHFMIYYYYNVSTPSQFSARYGLTTTQVGLCFIPQGVGCVLGSFLSGKQLDYFYRRAETKYKSQHPDVVVERGKVPIDFPLYLTRTMLMLPCGLVVQLLTIVYGWMLQINGSLAGLLVLQFLVALATIPISGMSQTLLVDLYPGKGASITASNNLVRCILGAIASVTSDPGIRRLDVGWFFTTIGLIVFAFNSFYLILLVLGPKWRAKRYSINEAA
ncbi:MFS general substrate transporter [Hesseltinella vesiculosa]|uniref:MFS general substrate transporter n=1 Tax=Hesseltinella vesiculosa TaxID=101127 RepID=A0A1X2GX85_9FUNG|nr:MFS general substrate transporter [Hesseltinella vesiculosa]